MTDSHELFVEYARNGSDAAFRELVTRYVDLVYSTALRLVEGDTHRAEDVAQTVFVDLARNARTLPKDVKLGGWLHRDACFVAAHTMRGERRRQSRERQAVEMNAVQNHTEADFSQVAPILDEAINELGEADRMAILLRFFEQHDFRSVGEVLGSNEDAARMRVTRALEKLAALLKRRGVTASSATLAVALGANAVQAAPLGLTATISAAAVLAGTITATTIATSTTMNWINAKAVAAIAASALISGTSTYVVQHLGNESLRTENAALRAQANRPAEMKEPQVANEPLPAQVKVEASGPESERQELLRLRGQVGALRQEVAALKAWREEQSSGYARLATEAKAKELASETIYKLRMIGYANRVYADNHGSMMPTNFNQLKPILRPDLIGWELDQFEFVDHGGAVSETEPNLALLRERTARQLADGRWARCYLYADGAAYQRISDDGNFDRFEKP